jgi:hypothetical protein
MKRLLLICCFTLPTLAIAQDGWHSIFDGKTLAGWDGDPKFWTVDDGALTGTTTKENPTQGNTFALWTGGEPGDFELKLKYKIVGGNSGIQYRSFKLPKGKDRWRMGGYQADIDSGDTYSGILYGEQFRGILANRGLITTLGEDGKPTTVGTLGDSKAIQARIKKEDWNEYHIIAKANVFKHFINGVQTSECTDNDSDTRRATGLLGLQLHAGPPMKVQFKDIMIQQAGSKTTAKAGKPAAKGKKAKANKATAEAKPKKKAASTLASEAKDFTVQITPNGGFVLRSEPLDADAMKEALAALAQANPEATIRIQAGKAASKEHAKAVRTAAKEAGVQLRARNNKRKQ